MKEERENQEEVASETNQTTLVLSGVIKEGGTSHGFCLIDHNFVIRASVLWIIQSKHFVAWRMFPSENRDLEEIVW